MEKGHLTLNQKSLILKRIKHKIDPEVKKAEREMNNTLNSYSSLNKKRMKNYIKYKSETKSFSKDYYKSSKKFLNKNDNLAPYKDLMIEYSKRGYKIPKITLESSIFKEIPLLTGKKEIDLFYISKYGKRKNLNSFDDKYKKYLDTMNYIIIDKRIRPKKEKNISDEVRTALFNSSIFPNRKDIYIKRENLILKSQNNKLITSLNDLDMEYKKCKNNKRLSTQDNNIYGGFNTVVNRRIKDKINFTLDNTNNYYFNPETHHKDNIDKKQTNYNKANKKFLIRNQKYKKRRIERMESINISNYQKDKLVRNMMSKDYLRNIFGKNKLKDQKKPIFSIDMENFKKLDRDKMAEILYNVNIKDTKDNKYKNYVNIYKEKYQSSYLNTADKRQGECESKNFINNTRVINSIIDNYNVPLEFTDPVINENKTEEMRNKLENVKVVDFKIKKFKKLLLNKLNKLE